MKRLYAALAIFILGEGANAQPYDSTNLKCTLSIKAENRYSGQGTVFEEVEYYQFSKDFFREYDEKDGYFTINKCDVRECIISESKLKVIGEPDGSNKKEILDIDRTNGKMFFLMDDKDIEKVYIGTGHCEKIDKFPMPKPRKKKF